jgi:hypothetical protein
MRVLEIIYVQSGAIFHGLLFESLLLAQLEVCEWKKWHNSLGYGRRGDKNKGGG